MRNSCMGLVFLSGLIFNACVSSFEPRITAHELKSNGLPTVKETREGLEVSLEEFVSPNKSRRAFDANLAAQGVLPILVRIENKGAAVYKVRQNEITATLDGQPLSSLYAYEAANEGALRNATWNALVNTAAIGPLAIFFWPATMAGSATQTQTINRKVEHHFENMELTDTVLKPDETAAGFVFVKIPDSLHRLENLQVELLIEREASEETMGRVLTYAFSLPPLEVRP